MSGTPGRSASGARLAGDDLQHALAWFFALQTLPLGSNVRSVTVEADDAGNVDDVVVEYVDGTADYNQIKAAVRASQPVSTQWLLEPSKANGPSLLRRLYASWCDLGCGGQGTLYLRTNRSLDTSDALLAGRDQDNKLAYAVRTAPGRGKVMKVAEQWCQHLGIDPDTMLGFLDSLVLMTDLTEGSLRESVTALSQGLGLRSDESAFLAGVGEVRDWVKHDRLPRTRREIEQVINKLNLSVVEPWSVVVVNALDHDHAEGAVAVLDWVDDFNGTEARTRRGLKRPDGWQDLRAELLEAAELLRQRNMYRVQVRGLMRLPTWFATGNAFAEVAHFVVSVVQHDEVWARGECSLPEVCVEPMPATADAIAVCVAISADPTADVREAPAVAGLPIYTVRLQEGISHTALRSGSHAFAAARAVRDQVRDLARTTGAKQLHLFLACPGGFAGALGHLWDRLPATQLYEDMNIGGYEPAFEIPN